MATRRLLGAAACGLAALVTAGCAGVGPFLAAPEGSTTCQGVQPGKPDPYWLGFPLQNLSDQPITLKAVRLGEHEGVRLDDAIAVPAEMPDGTVIGGVGTMHDPATNNPEIWAAGRPVAGVVVLPHARVSIAVALSRTTPAGGWAQSQVVTYQVRGEPFDREVTSRLGLGLMAECGPGEEAD